MPPTLVYAALGLLSLARVFPYARAQELLNFQPCPELNANISRITGVEEGLVFDCATLSVPLDYTDPNSEPLELELFRVNATQEPVLGTVLINFGGPGGTGAENLPAWGGEAQQNIGPQWNLVSWDPRGTGNTIPFQCDIGALSGTTPARKRDVGNLVSANLTDVFLNGAWEAAGLLADSCASQANDTGRLIGTAFVARDMIEIVDALGEDGLLRYYGWSYGSALGSYVAAMFPERVERMVLDANVNPHDYQAGHYGVSFDDTDEAFAGFIQACFDVGDDCAFYTQVQPTTAQDLLDALNLVLTPLVQNATSGPEAYLTYLSVKSIVVQPLYFPRTWPTLAETLASLLNETTAAPPATSGETYGPAQNALIGIRASDATFIANSSEEYLPQLELQSMVSPGFSDILYFAVWPSAQWRMPANERYWGNFQVSTKTPILYVNGNFDPVTPLVNAYNASATFEGSAVVAHNGYGHGIFAHPSQCVAQHIQAYFSNATLPPTDAHCEPDQSLVEVWRSTLEPTDDGSPSGGSSTDNSTGSEDDSSSDNSTVMESPNGASRRSTMSSFALATVLMVAALTFL